VSRRCLRPQVLMEEVREQLMKLQSPKSEVHLCFHLKRNWDKIHEVIQMEILLIFELLVSYQVPPKVEAREQKSMMFWIFFASLAY
jgi:hypothetical protein